MKRKQKRNSPPTGVQKTLPPALTPPLHTQCSTAPPKMFHATALTTTFTPGAPNPASAPVSSTTATRPRPLSNRS